MSVCAYDNAVDYHPYGTERIRLGDTQDQRQYAGTERDQESDLDYMINRYYSSDQGRFLSQDSVFLAVGDERKLGGIGNLSNQVVLSDPQLLNSYSYASNNPVLKKDPNGTCPICIPVAIGGGIGFLGGLGQQYIIDIHANRVGGANSLGELLERRSSFKEYAANAAGGATIGASAAFGVVAAGTAAAVSSIGQDKFLGNNVSLPKAAASGALTLFTGGLFKFGAGSSPLLSGSQFTNSALKQELRYSTGQEVFQSASSAIFQIQSQINHIQQQLNQLQQDKTKQK